MKRVGIAVISLACLAVLVTAGVYWAHHFRSFKQIQQSGQLRIATRNAPTTYYYNRHGQPDGFEYSLAKAYADSLGLEPVFILKNSVQATLDAVASGEADIAAAGITHTDAREAHFLFGPTYQQVSERVVCGSREGRAQNLLELANRDLRVVKHTSYIDSLTAHQKEYPKLHWQAVGDQTTEQLLNQVADNRFDCTVADSNLVDITRRYHPNLLDMFALNQQQPLAWAMTKRQTQLAESVEQWFAGYKESGELKRLQHQYYGYISEFDFVDKQILHQRLEDIFPKLAPLFEDAADAYELDWVLLAAQGYQESHWNVHAVSPTGVRGIMMLTLPTAKAMGVDNRLDPEQSIYGGARYLANLKRRLDPNIQEPDRTYLALAAYNIGLAHLRDAMQLAQQRGLNPYHWHDIKSVLPDLTNEQTYTQLAFGYARGTEAVQYVQRIRDYDDVIGRYAQIMVDAID